MFELNFMPLLWPVTFYLVLVLSSVLVILWLRQNSFTHAEVSRYPVCVNGQWCHITVCNFLVNAIQSNPAECIPVLINGFQISMEIDSGSGVTIMSQRLFSSHFKVALANSSVKLKTISSPVEVVGESVMLAQLSRSKAVSVKLVVVNTQIDFIPLLGRDWLDLLIPQWREFFREKAQLFSLANSVSNLIPLFKDKFPNVFSANSDSFIVGFKAHLRLEGNPSPIFLKAYPVPYALLPAVEAKIDEFVSSGKAIPVTFSRWASPCLPVPKKDKSVRLVIDFKRTINTCLKVDVYPIPNPEDIFASLAGGKIFCVLDLADAYTQLLIDDQSRDLLTVNTHKGLFQFTRLMYGIASAPAIFQQVMDQILFKLPNVVCYLDDILIKGKSYDECLSSVMCVLDRLNKHKVRVRVEKCIWFSTEVDYLGYNISEHGRKPSNLKQTAILEARRPTNVKEVKSFVGLVNFYAPLLPHLSTVVAPLRLLMKSGAIFSWSPECEQSFATCKELILSPKILMFYDPSLPIVVSCDASPVGLGALLSHTVIVNGSPVERPVLFASCSLNDTQMRYSQIDREALAIMFAIAKFHKYIWGRKFTLITDNAPLKHILNPSKGLPVLSASRLQHWAATLCGYQFTLEHRKSELLCPADALSRLPLCNTIFEEPLPPLFDGVPLSAVDVAEETRKDPVLSKAVFISTIGWPNHCADEALSPFFKIRDRLSVQENCLMYGNRVVIPLTLQAKVLSLLHEGHPGIVRSKLLARSYFWWPSMNSDIQTQCENCSSCAAINPKKDIVFTPWPKAQGPFKRVHLDYCELQKVMFLIICDSYSKWIDVIIVSSHTTEELVSHLQRFIATWGKPEVFVTDNEGCFDSDLFKAFCTSLSITLVHSPPHHPQSNGPAERAVQVVKYVLKKLALDANAVPLETRVFKFLMSYRNTPTTTTMKTPNELLLLYKPRTLISDLLPSGLTTEVSNAPFKPGDVVWLTINKQKLKGIVIRQLSKVQYLVDVEGVIKKPHINQMSYLPKKHSLL